MPEPDGMRRNFTDNEKAVADIVRRSRATRDGCCTAGEDKVDQVYGIIDVGLATSIGVSGQEHHSSRFHAPWPYYHGLLGLISGAAKPVRLFGARLALPMNDIEISFLDRQEREFHI